MCFVALWSFILLSAFMLSTLCALNILMHALCTNTYLCFNQDVFFCYPVLTPLWCLNSALLCFLRCVVFPGVIWSSSSRYSGRSAGAQHPSSHPEAQLPVEAGHEYFSGCLGATCWTCQGIYKHRKFRFSDKSYAAILCPPFVSW